MSFIKGRWAKNGVELVSDVRRINVIGPADITDNGNGDVDLDLNVSMEEVENVDLIGLANNDTLKYDANTNEWKRVASTPPPPPGTTAIVQFIQGSVPSISGSTSIPLDDTAPLITEGTEIWSESITPVESTSTIRVNNSLTVSSSSQNMEIIFALFRNNTCIGTVVGATIEKDSGLTVSFSFLSDAVDTTTATYSLRVGKVTNAGSWFINTISGTNNALNNTLTGTGYSISELTVLGS